MISNATKKIPAFNNSQSTSQKLERGDKERNLSVRNVSNKYGRRGGLSIRSSKSAQPQDSPALAQNTRALVTAGGNVQRVSTNNLPPPAIAYTSSNTIKKVGPPPKPPDQPLDILENQLMNDEEMCNDMLHDGQDDVVMGDASGHPQGS